MLTETFQAIATASCKVVRNWQSMLMVAALYACLLATLYFFVTIREASIPQVILTFALAVVAPVLFFVLQASVAGSTEEVNARSLIKRSVTDFWKLVLISVPLIALAILIAYLLTKAQVRLGAGIDTADGLPRPHPMGALARGREVAGQPIDWKLALVSTIRYLIFGAVLPLVLIHLWLATVHQGLGQALSKVKQHISRALSPQSVLIYIAGFIVFALIPYFLLFKTTSSSHAWLEIGLFVGRLALVFVLTLFGWVITVGALSVSSNKPEPAPANEAS
jgi:hypothetical protein